MALALVSLHYYFNNGTIYVDLFQLIFTKGDYSMKKILPIVLCFVFMFSLAAYFIENSSGQEKVNNDSSTTDSVKTSKDTISGENFDISVINIKSSNKFTNSLGVDYTAKDWNVLLFVGFSAKNKTNETKNIGPCFVASCDNKTVTPVSAVGNIDGFMPFVGAVASESTFEVYQIWELPKDWQNFKFSYLDAQTGSESETMQINCSDIS